MPDQRGKAAWEQFSDAFNWPEYTGKPSTYILASTGRSGSHFLAHQLFETGMLGSPFEYFHPRHFARWQKELNTSSVKQVIAALQKLRTSPTGWFGVKAHWHQFDEMMTTTELGMHFIPDHVIRIERRDKLAQAISMVIAKQTKAWISFHTPQVEPQYDFAAIKTEMTELDRQNAAWVEHINSTGTPSSVVYYEDLVANPGSSINMILSDMNLPEFDRPTAPVTDGPQLQATNRNMEWHARFSRELENRSDDTSANHGETARRDR